MSNLQSGASFEVFGCVLLSALGVTDFEVVLTLVYLILEATNAATDDLGCY